jgi:hypothetical protein
MYLGGHYRICVLSKDNDFYRTREKIKFSLTIDTDQDELDGMYIMINKYPIF